MQLIAIHPHMHLLINRVHPETGLVWNRWQDRAVIQKVLREEEIARTVPYAETLQPAVPAGDFGIGALKIAHHNGARSD